MIEPETDDLAASRAIIKAVIFSCIIYLIIFLGVR